LPTFSPYICITSKQSFAQSFKALTSLRTKIDHYIFSITPVSCKKEKTVLNHRQPTTQGSNAKLLHTFGSKNTQKEKAGECERERVGQSQKDPAMHM
jgi:hypothetical protein